jgi:hypothetical protein
MTAVAIRTRRHVVHRAQGAVAHRESPARRLCARLQPTRRRLGGACALVRRGLRRPHGRSAQRDAVRRCEPPPSARPRSARPDVARESFARGGTAEEVVAHCLAASGGLREVAVPQALRDQLAVKLGKYLHDPARRIMPTMSSVRHVVERVGVRAGAFAPV